MSHLLKSLLSLLIILLGACNNDAGVKLSTTSPDMTSSTQVSPPVDMDAHLPRGGSGALPMPDAGRPPPDAGRPPPDIGLGPPDAGRPLPDAGAPPPRPPYEGLGLEIADSPLFLDAAALERDETDGYRLSFPTARLVPRIDGMGDTADLVAWFPYRLDVAGDWRWLRVALFLDAEAEPIPSTPRVMVGRLTSWFAMGEGGLSPLQSGGADGVLRAGGLPLCGQASVGARFSVHYPDGGRVVDAVGVAQLVDRRGTLTLDWLRGCSITSIP